MQLFEFLANKQTKYASEKSKIKLYLGCAEPPFHKQHLEVLNDPDDWIWVDLYVKHKNVQNWDATKLTEVKSSSVDHIYASHLLEHFPQKDIRKILKVWFKKLKKGGILTLNVPDIVWVAGKILEYDTGKKLSGYFTDFEGSNGLMSILYGSQVHEGEYHKAGFSEKFLRALLKETGFAKITTETKVDAHDMGVVIATARK